MFISPCFCLRFLKSTSNVNLVTTSVLLHLDRKYLFQPRYLPDWFVFINIMSVLILKLLLTKTEKKMLLNTLSCFKIINFLVFLYLQFLVYQFLKMFVFCTFSKYDSYFYLLHKEILYLLNFKLYLISFCHALRAISAIIESENWINLKCFDWKK